EDRDRQQSSRGEGRREAEEGPNALGRRLPALAGLASDERPAERRGRRDEVEQLHPVRPPGDQPPHEPDEKSRPEGEERNKEAGAARLALRPFPRGGRHQEEQRGGDEVEPRDLGENREPRADSGREDPSAAARVQEPQERRRPDGREKEVVPGWHPDE